MRRFGRDIGCVMYEWAKDLWPVNRSITGEGVRSTLNYLQGLVPGLVVKSIPTGAQVFDWRIPKEWVISEAYIEDHKGSRIIDFRDNNLHVLGYSVAVDDVLNLSELKKNIYTLPEQPDAIPYVTSYYSERWGFCMSHNQLASLEDGLYHVVIKSSLKEGVLNYGELIIKGRSDKEVFLSTYVCHPSMANNELSGPVVTSAIAQWLLSKKDLRYTYRIVWIPETIGSIAYISENLFHLKKHVVAGYNVTCIGDDHCYSYLPSRNGNTLSDQVAKYVLKNIDKNYKSYSWLDRGSDERQYCAPGVDLPVATIMRSKYGEYREYHTSLDNLSFISPKGLMGGYSALQSALSIIEKNFTPIVKVLCEPQLGRRGLYPTLSGKNMNVEVRNMMNIISYCDGSKSILEISEMLELEFEYVFDMVSQLSLFDLVSLC